MGCRSGLPSQEGLEHEHDRTMSHKTSALTVYVTKYVPRCPVEACFSPCVQSFLGLRRRSIANLSDAAIGRKQLQRHLNDLKELSKSKEPLVQKHATIAVQRVTWKP